MCNRADHQKHQLQREYRASTFASSRVLAGLACVVYNFLATEEQLTIDHEVKYLSLDLCHTAGVPVNLVDDYHGFDAARKRLPRKQSYDVLYLFSCAHAGIGHATALKRMVGSKQNATFFKEEAAQEDRGRTTIYSQQSHKAKISGLCSVLQQDEQAHLHEHEFRLGHRALGGINEKANTCERHQISETKLRRCRECAFIHTLFVQLSRDFDFGFLRYVDLLEAKI